MIQEKENFQTNLLNIEQIYKLEIGKFMFRYNANQLPTSFIKYFTSIQSIHTVLCKLIDSLQKNTKNFIFSIYFHFKATRTIFNRKYGHLYL